jgi:hypothetical protein
MRYNDAKCDRNHRWIEVQRGLMASRVPSHVAASQDMSFELLPRGAISTV